MARCMLVSLLAWPSLAASGDPLTVTFPEQPPVPVVPSSLLVAEHRGMVEVDNIAVDSARVDRIAPLQAGNSSPPLHALHSYLHCKPVPLCRASCMT